MAFLVCLKAGTAPIAGKHCTHGPFKPELSIYLLKARSVNVSTDLAPENGDSCDSDSSSSTEGRDRREKPNHEDLDDLKGASAFASSASAAFGQHLCAWRCADAEGVKALAFHSSGRAFFEVLEVSVVSFSGQCLNRNSESLVVDLFSFEPEN